MHVSHGLDGSHDLAHASYALNPNFVLGLREVLPLGLIHTDRYIEEADAHKPRCYPVVYTEKYNEMPSWTRLMQQRSRPKCGLCHLPAV